jgi:hypothetical protein
VNANELNSASLHSTFSILAAHSPSRAVTTPAPANFATEFHPHHERRIKRIGVARSQMAGRWALPSQSAGADHYVK